MTTYPFWIEHDENGNPINNLWVKIDNIPASSTKTIYIHPEGFNFPDGDSVFEFFDDFEGSSLDTSKWSFSGNNAQYSVSNSMVTLTGTTRSSSTEANIYSTQTFNYPIIVNAHYKTDYTGLGGSSEYQRVRFRLYHSSADYLELTYDVQGTTYWGGNCYISGANYGSEDYDDNYNIQNLWQNDYFVFTGTKGYIYDGITHQKHFQYSCSQTPTNYDYQLTFCHWYSASSIYADWIAVRKYTANEPSVTITDMGTYYKIDITNNEATDLTNYQVAIPISSLDITSTTESIEFTESTAQEEKNKTIHFSHNF